MLFERLSVLYQYWILWILFEAFAVASVVLIAVLFGPKYIIKDAYKWETNPFGYHPLMMVIGLFFLYSNAILIYRTFRKQEKILLKVLHAFILIGSLAFALVGLTAIIRNKDIGKRLHLMSYHAWIGLFTLFLFFLQWLAGLTIFLFPGASLQLRREYLSSHRFWGQTIFICAVISLLTGLSGYGSTSSYFPPFDADRSKRMLIIFSCLCISFGTIIVLFLLSQLKFQRSEVPANNVHPFPAPPPPDYIELHSNKF